MLKNHIIKIKFILAIFLLTTQSAISQSYTEKQLVLTKSDSAEIKKSLENAEFQKQKGDLKEESRFYNKIAQLYWDKFYYLEAVKYFEKSVEINKKLDNQSGLSMIYNDIGVINTDLGFYEKALTYFKRNLDYKRSVNEPVGIITAMRNISIVYAKLKKYDESIKLLEEALKISKEINDLEQIKSCYGIMSETYEKAGMPEKAYEYFNLYRSFHEKSLEEKEKENKRLVEETYLKLKLSETESRNKQLELTLADRELKEKEKQLTEADKAKKMLYSNLSKSEMQNKLLQQDNQIKQISILKEKAQNEKQKSRIIFLLIVTLLAISVLVLAIWAYIGKRRTSIQLAEQNRKIIFQKNEIEKLSVVASQTDNSVMITDKTGNIEWINNGFMKMYGYSIDELAKHRINIHNFEFIKSSEFEIIKTLQSGETQIYESRFIQKNGQGIWVQTTLTPITDNEGNVTKLIFIDSNIQKIKESEKKITQQKEQIEKQQKTLTDSINYAQYIQDTILYGNNSFRNIISKYFVLYKPRNVVSGDFYWFAHEKDFEIIVASDCTGHGVPGAFLSLIGVNILNRIVKNEKNVMPDKIIQKLHAGFQKSLNQSNNDNTDGMDVAVCTIDHKNKKLYFSGANRPIVYVQNNQLKSIRGDLMSVGGIIYNSNDKRKFTIHEINIENQTSFYLFSDGFADQFGGPLNKKFNNANLYNLIKNNYEKPLNEQKNIFENTFNEWKKDQNQVDDILLIGVKI